MCVFFCFLLLFFFVVVFFCFVFFFVFSSPEPKAQGEVL